MANSVPTLTDLTTPVTFLENTVNGAPQIIAVDVTFTDPDNNFNTGTLTVADLLAQDTVAIRNQGIGAGQIGVAGSDVSFGGTLIGSFAGGGGSTLTVTFNAAATAAAIEALIENLTYANSSDAPTASHSLELKVTDAAGFAAIAPIAFAQQTGAANPFNGVDVGVVSTPSFADLDGDGDLDAVVGEGFGTLHYFENTGSATAPAFTERTGAANPFNGVDVGSDCAPSFADLDGDGDLDAVVGAFDGTLRYFENTGSAIAPAFTARTGAANPFDGLDVGYDSTPSFADLDGDGDLDAVVGERYGTLRYFENTGSAIAPAFTARTGAANPFNGVDVGRSSTPSFADLDGDGDLDAVVGERYGTLLYFENTGTATASAFTARTSAANPFNGVDVGDFSTPVFADLDGDGHLDAVVGEYNGNLNYFKNTTPHQPAPDFAEQTGAANPFNGVDVGYQSTPTFADLDGDGDLDAVVGENNGNLNYFQNTGSALAPAFTQQFGAANPFISVDVGDWSTPSFADLDGDGDLDAVVGEFYGTLRYFQNTGTATAPAFTERTGAANPFNGVVVGNWIAPSFADLDGDGDLDAVVGERYGILHYFQNTGSATAPALTERTGAANPFDGVAVGFSSAPTFADLDGDGDLDAVVGEGNGTLRYFLNTGAGFTQVVNVTAQNDAATLSADVRNLTEANTAAAISSSGTLTISDPDSPATFVAQAGTVGLYGTFAINSAGAWTYTASSAHNEFVAGTTHTDIFQVASADGTPTSVTINIAGTDDVSVPTLTGLTTPVTFLENTVNAAPQIIDANVTFTFTDLDSNFDTGTLTVAHLLAEDTVAIRNQGTGAGQIGVSGGNVSFGGTLIGSFAGGAGSTLAVTFNANATAAAIEALIENLTYANSSDAPTASHSLELKVTDAAGFAAIAPIAFAEQAGAANPFNAIDVGYNGTPSFADIDGDGDLDALVGERYGTLRYFENTGTATAPVFTERTGAANPFNGVDVSYLSTPSFADLDGDGDLDAVAGDGFGTLHYFENTGSAIAPAFTERTGAAYPFDGVDVGGFSAPGFADLDGDLDAVVGELFGTLHYFENTGSATAPAFTERTGAANPFDGVDVGRSSMPSFADLDGDGDLDALVGEGNGTLRYFENTGTATAPVFTARTGAANPFDGVDVGNYSKPSFADLDGDGDLDALVGEQYGTLRYFENTTPQQPAPGFVQQTGAANPFNGVDVGNFSTPSLADLDGDGDLDALVGENGGTLRYFENNGSAIAPAFTERTGAANPFDGVDVAFNSSPSFADLDGDGDLDAVIGTQDGTLHYFQNTGSAIVPAFTEQTGAANPFSFVDVGTRSTPSFVDLDGDGDLDAVVGEEYGTLHYFENTGSAVAPAFTELTGAANPFDGVNVGFNARPSFADLDGDGDLDAIVGSYGSLRYFENTGSAIAPAFSERTGAANPLDGVVVDLLSKPSFADLDGDGHLDLVVGEWFGALHYFKNTGAGFTQVVDVTAQNDAAVLSADVRNLTEANTAAAISSSGTLTISDPDGAASFVAQAGTVGLYGTFAITSAGAWTYAASSAHNEFAAGTTHADTFAVASSDGTPTSVTINIAGSNDTPVANAQSLGTDKDTAVALTLSGSDVDGDSLAFAVLSGPAHGTLSGGGANRTYTPDPGYLGPDSFSYVANDGTLNSAAATVSLNVHLNIAPGVTAFDQSAVRGQVFNASDLFSATDGDGDTLLYFFWDNNPDPASGYFTVNGVVQAAHTTFAVTAAQLAQTTFTAGQLSDDLFVNTWDFSLFSGPQEFHVNVPANQAPTVTAADFSASKGQVVSASDLFTANDANGDPLLYFFYDNSAAPTSGHFTVNGVVQAANTTFAVTAAQLATTTFTAGTAVSDDLFVNVWNSVAFSGPKEFHVNVVNNAPTVTAPNQTASSGQVLNASSLFTANDADGDSLLYFFYDNSAAPTSGHFDVNGQVQAAGTTFAVTQAQLANTTFVAGTTGDDLFVNVWDQASFSGPKEFHVDLA